MLTKRFFFGDLYQHHFIIRRGETKIWTPSYCGVFQRSIEMCWRKWAWKKHEKEKYRFWKRKHDHPPLLPCTVFSPSFTSPLSTLTFISLNRFKKTTTRPFPQRELCRIIGSVEFVPEHLLEIRHFVLLPERPVVPGTKSLTKSLMEAVADFLERCLNTWAAKEGIVIQSRFVHKVCLPDWIAFACTQQAITCWWLLQTKTPISLICKSTIWT